MAGNLTPKKFTYKQAKYLQKNGSTLQGDLRKALTKAKLVGERKQLITAAESTFFFLNSVRNRWGMTFGSMLVYSRGKNQHLVTQIDDAEELPVGQLAPPRDKTGAFTDFVESLLFFGVLDNHLVLVQSAGLRARQFEIHLNWLLQTKTKVMDEEDRVELSDQPSPQAAAAVQNSPVKKVSLGVPLQTRPTTSKHSIEKASFRADGVGFDLLDRLIGGDWVKKMKLSDSLDTSRLQVEVNVTYKRAISDEGQDVLNDIALQLRHQDEDDVVIELKNGVKLTGSDIKVSGPVSVITYDGLVDPDDLYPKMKDWLKEQIELGVVR